MKTLRRLAFLALFGLATVATAGPPAGNAPAANAPTRNAPKLFTANDLGEMLQSQYGEVKAVGVGDAKVFASPKLPHKLKSGDRTVTWSVLFNLMTRGDRPPAVRIYFPCQKLPAKPHSDRLARLMGQSGGGSNSPAYFMVGGKDSDWLYIVAEVTTDGLKGDILREEVIDLFAFAKRTLSLRGEDLTIAPTKPAAKGDATAVVGVWGIHPEDRSNLPKPTVIGLNSITFSDDGGVVALILGGRTNNSTDRTRGGNYTVKGDQLTIRYESSDAVENYTFKLNDSKLTLTHDKGNPSQEVIALFKRQ